VLHGMTKLVELPGLQVEELPIERSRKVSRSRAMQRVRSTLILCKLMNDTDGRIAKKICLMSLSGGLSYISKLVYFKS
jgi:hypothetical protein